MMLSTSECRCKRVSGSMVIDQIRIHKVAATRSEVLELSMLLIAMFVRAVLGSEQDVRIQLVLAITIIRKKQREMVARVIAIECNYTNTNCPQRPVPPTYKPSIQLNRSNIIDWPVNSMATRTVCGRRTKSVIHAMGKG